MGTVLERASGIPVVVFSYFRFLILEAYLVFYMFIIAEAFDIPYFYHAVLYQQLYSYIMELANLRTKLLFINNEYQKY